MGERTSAVEISAEDSRDLLAVYRELRGQSGIEVAAESAPEVPGEQGAAIELLTVALSGGAVASLIDLVRAFVESRGPAFKLTFRNGKQKLDIQADNLDEAEPLLRQLLDGS